jgi:hypothetical protein
MDYLLKKTEEEFYYSGKSKKILEEDLDMKIGASKPAKNIYFHHDANIIVMHISIPSGLMGLTQAF